MPDVPQIPDYELADTAVVDTAARLKAFADPTRAAILGLLLERAATTTELAAAFGKPKGTIDHHLKVLAAADAVRVVRTRQVRAMTEKFWGRTARTFYFSSIEGEVPTELWMVRDAHAEIERSVTAGLTDESGFVTLRHARIAPERMAEFEARLEELAADFAGAERGGDRVTGLFIAMYPTDLPTLPGGGEPEDRS